MIDAQTRKNLTHLQSILPFKDSSVEKLPNFVLEVLRTKRVFDLKGNPQALESNVSLSEASSLHAAVRLIRPMRSLEIGLAHRVSALSILGAIAANGSGHHYVIDPFQRNYGYCGEAMSARAGLSALHTFLERYPEEVIPNLLGLQFAFIDSWHLCDLTILVIFKKASDDQHDWRFHQRF